MSHAKTILCRCEDVTVHEFAAAFREGFTELESLKRYTGVGTGFCQGKGCLCESALELARLRGVDPAEIPPTNIRPPTEPLTFGELAAHCAPVLWFSPDEPLLDGLVRPGEINLPLPFPFEEDTGQPVVYYRLRNVIYGRDDVSEIPALPRANDTEINFDQVSAVDLDFFFYYPSEEGLGGHVHDVEAVEMKIAIYRQKECQECRYGVVVALVNAKAHGILWYDNTLEVDRYTHFPMTILVEEGKHDELIERPGGYYRELYAQSTL